MRVLICGDRNWTNHESIQRLIYWIHPETIIEGHAPGADIMAFHLADDLSIEVLSFPAQWKKYGKAAGVIRNQQMLNGGHPDLVVAFHSDIINSADTADMLCRAEDNNIPYTLIEGEK